MTSEIPIAADARQRRAVGALGRVVLVLSGLGFPPTQAAIARGGRRGAIAVEGIAVGLLIRDAALVRMGTPALLGRIPRGLLWLEVGAAAAAACLGPVAIARPWQRIDSTPAGALEAGTQFAMGLLFGVHTYRYSIYLAPGHGLRAAP